jgi:hypothetical protein
MTTATADAADARRSYAESYSRMADKLIEFLEQAPVVGAVEATV